MGGQRFDPAAEVARAREIATDWERKHQDLAGELAAATAREQRLREELKNAAERLQDFSQNSRGKGTKDEAAQLAQNARLQASLAEAEAIAARERLRASEVERKLTEMADLLSSATAREEELRRGIAGDSGDDPARRTEYIDQSLEMARLNARLAETETALANARRAAESGDAGTGASERADAVAERGRLESKITDLERSLSDARQATQTSEAERQSSLGELAAARAREEALHGELRAAADQHQRLQAEAEERDRLREQAHEGETTHLQNELRDSQEAAQRASERLTALEARTQELAGQLAATSTREEALREELESTSLAQQARVLELEALLEHERSLVLDWQRKHQLLDNEYRATADRERQRLADAIHDEVAAKDAELGQELLKLRDRLSDVEAAAARDATRAEEWEQRCTGLSTQLDETQGRNTIVERELQELRGQLSARSADAAAAAAEKAVETETLGARLAAAEAARATSEQSVASWVQRHDALVAELEASTARAEELARALEAFRTGNASERVEAEGARAAALAEAEATRAALAEAQQRAEALARELEERRDATNVLEDQLSSLQRDLDQRIQAAPAPAAAPARASTAPQRPAPPVAVSATVKSDVHRIAVIDDPATWANVKLHGLETILIAPTDDVAARLAESPVDRVLVNLSARGSFDAALNARAAGATAPFCGCLLPPGMPRGLALGYVEVARTPLDPDEIVTVLAPFAAAAPACSRRAQTPTPSSASARRCRGKACRCPWRGTASRHRTSCRWCGPRWWWSISTFRPAAAFRSSSSSRQRDRHSP